MTDPRVVAGVDGSPLGTAAVLRAAHLASTRGLPLHLVHALAPDLPLLGFREPADREVVTAHGRALLRTAAARAHASHPGLTVTTAVTDGFAGQALVRASHRAALVAVGSSGFSLQSRVSIGAVVLQVLAHAACPVLVVTHEGGGAPVPGGRVVVGLDGSEDSRHALAVAADEAEAVDGLLEAVHVRRPGDPAWPPTDAAAGSAAHEAALEHEVRAVLAAARPAAGTRKVEVHLEEGDPVTVLATHAEGAGTLVVGARGAGGFDGLHVGSTTLRLVGRSAAPVLVTR